MRYATPFRIALSTLLVAALGACGTRSGAVRAEGSAPPPTPPATGSAPETETTAVNPEPKTAAAKARTSRPAAASEGRAAPVQRAVAAGRAAAPPAPRAASEWAQFRGPGGAGISPEAVPTSWSASEGIVWKTELPGAGTSSPILLGSRVFLTCYSGYSGPGQPGSSPDQLRRHVVCLDRATGKLLWNSEVPGKTGEEASIREDHGYASSTPAADAERVYAFFGRSGVFAIDHQGKQLWRADVGDRTHNWGSAASPVLHGNLVIINASVESESLVGLDRRTGKEVWRTGGIKESWNTPILVRNPAGKTELVVAIFRAVQGFDPETGERLWSCDTGINWYMVPSLVSRDGVVYCIGGRGGGGSLAIRTGGRGDVTGSHRLWKGDVGSNVPSPILHGDHLYWMRDSPAVAFCADAKTGRILYEERVPGADQVYASPVLAGGNLYYLSRGGRMFIVPAKPTFEVLATNELGERATYNSTPAAAGGRLYLRSDRHLYCIGR
ncbi:MAG: PQQ-binding-like beta-propeller repeat protein [Armatimonadota bacterium]